MTDLYVCTDILVGDCGNCTIATTPKEAFEQFCYYYDDNAKIEELYIYKLGPELKGSTSYTFKEAGT